MPITVWFSVLYYHYTHSIEIGGIIKLAMVIVEIIFVINSLDSLMRLYTVNQKLTADEIGKKKYIIGYFITMSGLILLYKFSPFKIEWADLVVIGIYAAINCLLYLRKNSLRT